MATSSNLANFAGSVPAHGVTTDIAINGGLRKAIGHDAQYNNYFCVGVPFTTPANIQINSITFTLSVHSTGSHHYGDEMQRGWVAWISTAKYESTVGTSVYSTVTNNAPHYTGLLIPQAEGAVSRTVTFTIDKNTFNYQPNQQYYIYIWNTYRNSSKHYMWYVDNLTAIANYDSIYTISYNANGGTGAPASQTKTHGTNLTLSTTKPTKSATTSTITTIFDGNGGTSSSSSINSTKTTTYTFNNWKATDGSTYNAGGTYTKNESTTMTAQWTGNNPTYSTFTTPTATRDGYIFKGWSYDKNATSGLTGQISPTSNGTLYAIWEKSTQCFIKINGKWVPGTIYIKVNGQWKIGSPAIKINNAWHQ